MEYTEGIANTALPTSGLYATLEPKSSASTAHIETHAAPIHRTTTRSATGSPCAPGRAGIPCQGSRVLCQPTFTPALLARVARSGLHSLNR